MTRQRVGWSPRLWKCEHGGREYRSSRL
jgi:hypothetical protein